MNLLFASIVLHLLLSLIVCCCYTLFYCLQFSFASIVCTDCLRYSLLFEPTVCRHCVASTPFTYCLLLLFSILLFGTCLRIYTFYFYYYMHLLLRIIVCIYYYYFCLHVCFLSFSTVTIYTQYLELLFAILTVIYSCSFHCCLLSFCTYCSRHCFYLLFAVLFTIV